jgi:hypothetical protein
MAEIGCKNIELLIEKHRMVGLMDFQTIQPILNVLTALNKKSKLLKLL